MDSGRMIDLSVINLCNCSPISRAAARFNAFLSEGSGAVKSSDDEPLFVSGYIVNG